MTNRTNYYKPMGKGVKDLYQQLTWSNKIPTPHAEYRFAHPRRWRFDLAYPEEKIAIEFEGGTWTNGRHTRGSGYQKDLYKYNTAQLLGWFVFRFTSQDVVSGYALRTIESAFEGKPFLETPDVPGLSQSPATPRSPQTKGAP